MLLVIIIYNFLFNEKLYLEIVKFNLIINLIHTSKIVASKFK